MDYFRFQQHLLLSCNFKISAMKKSVFLFTGILYVVLSLTMQAQTKTEINFYKGTWNAAFDGPQGTVKMVIGFEHTGEKTVATLKDEAGKELYKVVKTEIKENKATIIFIGSQGSEVDLVMTKKDDDHANCNIMGMYSAVAERKK